MALWTDNRKCMLVGRSGLQYQATLLATLSPASAQQRVTEFYQSHGATPKDTPGGNGLTLIRGRRWVSRLSWLMPLSERWPQQTITVSFSPQEQSTQITVSYDVAMFFTIIFPPCALAKEARELQTLLQHAHTA